MIWQEIMNYSLPQGREFDLDYITSLFIVYRYDSTTGTSTVPSGGDGYYYFSVYCLQIWQYNWNIYSALWWRWILLLLCLLFTDMTIQLEHSQCPLVEMDTITSLFIIYRYDNTTGTFTVLPGGDGFYYFFVYYLQIWQYNWNIYSALWWRWILLLLCLLFTDTTAQPEHSQCPLVEMDSFISLFIVYRYDSTTRTFTVPPGGARFYYFSVYCLQIRQHNRNIRSAPWWRRILLFFYLLFTDTMAQPEHSHCPLVEMDSVTSLFIVYRYDNTTGTFTVPPGGDGFYYFSAFLDGNTGEDGIFDLEINGEQLCSIELDQQGSGDQGQSSCSAAIYAVEGLSQNHSNNNWFYFLLYFIDNDHLQIVQINFISLLQ